MKAIRIIEKPEQLLIKPYVPFLFYPWFRDEDIRENTFNFLNIKYCFKDDIDWQVPRQNRSWRYNLHYFQYIHLCGGLDQITCVSLIHEWIKKNPPGTKDAWDAFPTSLRVVNWIKYINRFQLANEDLEVILCSIYHQSLCLERSLERHLLANHLFKNLKALIFAGLSFEGSDAERWLAKGLRLLDRELAEQILPDGGHFERSPMYHCMILEDCLDLLNIFNDKFQGECVRLKKLLSSVCQDMVRFLSGMLHPDGGIALFNDSAFGIELPPNRILAYAYSLLQMPMKPAKGQCWSFPESGYFVIAPDDGDRMIIDCGLVGPDYQPGHAHCDTLSFELSLDGQRVIVDSGVYDYEKSEMRQYVRSTKAHNTVMVDGEDQSEMWGAFRVARRAKPIYARIHTVERHRVSFLGAHDGYKRLPGKVIHERFIEFDETSGWIIIDRVSGKRKHYVENFIHIHPDLKAVIEGIEIQLLDRRSNKRKARIVVLTPVKINLAKGWYCPEFGLKLENDIIILATSNFLPIEMRYTIIKN